MRETIVRESAAMWEVNLLGDFRISNGETALFGRDMRSEKLPLLLAYLLDNYERKISVQELVDFLWPDGESLHPVEALKNLVYRLRNVLAKAWPGEKLILSAKRCYYWNPSVAVSVDVAEFETCCQRLKTETDKQKQRALYEKAAALYKGKFMPELSDVSWAFNRDTYLRNQFLDVMGSYCALLEETGDFSEMERVCIIALEAEPLQETLHIYLLKAYTAMNRPDLAEEHYQLTEKIYYQMLGEEIPKEISMIYLQTMKREHREERDLLKIQRRLLEEKQNKGAFYCDYGLFVKLYDLETRRLPRDRRAVTISLITLGSYTGETTENQPRREEMEDLKAAIRETLRSGDVVTRYSATQYLIMLPACTEADGEKVMQRLRNNFYVHRRLKRLHLKYKLVEMRPDAPKDEG